MKPVSMDFGSMALQGFGMDSARLMRLAETTGLPLWSHHLETVFERVVVLSGAVVPGHVESFPWLPPVAIWIEAEGMPDGNLHSLLARASRYDLFASFTTATANELPVAGGLLSAITARHSLDSERREDIELALHEALSNAILHGNLSLDGLKKLSVDDLDIFSQMIAARMSDPCFSKRRIEIGLAIEGDYFTVDITDEGCGFLTNADAPIREAAHNPWQPSGRGFELIGAIARRFRILDHGRHIWMEFGL